MSKNCQWTAQTFYYSHTFIYIHVVKLVINYTINDFYFVAIKDGNYIHRDFSSK